MNRTQFLAVLVIVSSTVNTVVHFLHPSYRYYRQRSDDLNSQFDDFKSEVQNQFVPSILALSSNIVTRSVSSSNVTSVTRSDLQRSSIQDLKLSYLYYVHEGRPYARICGYDYTLGDVIYGSPVVSITPDSLRSLNLVIINSSFNHDYNTVSSRAVESTTL